MATTPEDADALFDAASPAPPPGEPAAAPGKPAVEARRESRVKVSWPARCQLPNGKVVELRLRDLSEGGVGLVTQQHLPPSTVLNFAVGVPGFNDPTKIVPVTGTIRTTYVVLQGRDLFCGAQFLSLPDDGRELIVKWIRRLRK